MGKLKNTFLTLLLVALLVILILYFPYIIIFMFYFVTLLSQKLMSKNFNRLKAQALGVSIEDLEKESEEDEYLCEIDYQ